MYHAAMDVQIRISAVDKSVIVKEYSTDFINGYAPKVIPFT